MENLQTQHELLYRNGLHGTPCSTEADNPERLGQWQWQGVMCTQPPKK